MKKEVKELMNLKENRLILIGGRPSTGKTSLILDITKEVALNDKIPVVVFSLETGIKKCVDLILGENKTLDYIKELSEANIFIDDTPAISVETIKEKCIKLKKEKNIGLIIIDYLQLIQVDGQYKNRELEIAKVSLTLKKLSHELNIPIIITSQLSAEIEKREDKRPRLVDVHSAVEQDSDVVMFLYNENNNREIIIAKNRYGDIGTIKG